MGAASGWMATRLGRALEVCWVCALSVSCAILSAQTVSGPDDAKIAVTASVERRTYRPDEVFRVTCTLENIGRHVAYIPKELVDLEGIGFSVEVLDTQGRHVPVWEKSLAQDIFHFGPEDDDLVSKGSISIPPGGIYGVRLPVILSAPGEYKLVVRHRSLDDAKPEARAAGEVAAFALSRGHGRASGRTDLDSGRKIGRGDVYLLGRFAGQEGRGHNDNSLRLLRR